MRGNYEVHSLLNRSSDELVVSIFFKEFNTALLHLSRI